MNDTFTMGFILCPGRTRTGGESLGSELTAAGGGVKGGERVAAVGVQRSPAVGKAHTGHRNRTPAPKREVPLGAPLFLLYLRSRTEGVSPVGNARRFLPFLDKIIPI